MNRRFLKINLKLQTIDKVMLSWLLFFVLLQFRTHILISESKIVISIVCFSLFLFRFILICRCKAKEDWLFSLVATVVVLVLITIISFFSNKTYLIGNTRELFFPLTLFLYTSVLTYDESSLDRFFISILPLLNIYFVINSFIIYLQVNGHDYLLDTTYYSELKFDYMSGLFGGNDGTHRLTLFTSFITLLMLHYFKSLRKKQKWVNGLLFIIGIVSTTYLSTQIDNIAYFVFVPLSVAVYFAVASQKFRNFAKKMVKPSIFIFAIYLLLNILVKNDSSGFGKILNRLNMTIFAYGGLWDFISNSTDERAILFSFAVVNGGLLGKGLGSIRILGEPSINLHFGMASAQSLIYLIGVLPYLIYIFIISKIYTVSAQ